MAVGDAYEVQAIVDRREVDGAIEFKVDWGKKWGRAGRYTWEPMENLDCDEKMDAFMMAQAGGSASQEPNKRKRKVRE